MREVIHFRRAKTASCCTAEEIWAIRYPTAVVGYNGASQRGGWCLYPSKGLRAKADQLLYLCYLAECDADLCARRSSTYIHQTNCSAG